MFGRRADRSDEVQKLANEAGLRRHGLLQQSELCESKNQTAVSAKSVPSLAKTGAVVASNPFASATLWSVGYANSLWMAMLAPLPKRREFQLSALMFAQVTISILSMFGHAPVFIAWPDTQSRSSCARLSAGVAVKSTVANRMACPVDRGAGADTRPRVFKVSGKHRFPL